MKIINNIVVFLFLSLAINVLAQDKLTKVSKKIEVQKDVVIDLNTSFVQIEIDTWNKNTVEVEAYIEGEKLSQKELQAALKDWNLKVEGSGDYVKITSEGALQNSWSDSGDFRFRLESLEALKELEFLGEVEFFEMPEMPEMPEIPELPETPAFPNLEVPKVPKLPKIPKLPKGIKNVNFDSEAYKKGGEDYLETWSQDYPSEDRENMKTWARKLGAVDFLSFEDNMEVWGEKFGKKFGDGYSKKLEVWGEEFGKRFDNEWAEKMEAWGEKYADQMEKKGKEIEKRFELREKQMGKLHEQQSKLNEQRHENKENWHQVYDRDFDKKSDAVQRTIKIKMPKRAKLNLNVRHGTLKIVSVIQNLKANIEHANLVASHIDGSETSINVSYSPVHVKTWSSGELNLKYVEDAQLNTVSSLILNSNSSNMHIDELSGNAIIDGSFGDLSIAKITDSCTSLNIILENSEAVISLPSTDYTVYFKGNRSRLNSEMTAQRTIESGQNSGKTIVLNTKFSDVVLK